MTTLQPYRQTAVTPDTYEALCRLERAAKRHGDITLLYEGVPARQASWEGVEKDAGPLGLPPHLSMRPTGREVYLRIRGVDDPMHRLAILWSLTVPLGFIPWSRYPVPSSTSHVFHYIGQWDTLGDFLHGEGRGDLAWPSMCCAAQVEVGTWAGDQITERTIQMHLHRLGIHCGPVDGVLGPVTLSALKALGLEGLESSLLISALRGLTVNAPQPQPARHQGSVILSGCPTTVFSTGGIHTVKTKTGYALTVDGPGRLIVEVGE